MPGDTPYEAVLAFVEPLREATAVLDARTNIAVTPRGGWALGGVYRWTLNDRHGADLGPAGRFSATMNFEIVRCDPRHEGVYRVSTRGYRYQLRRPDGCAAWRLDWHPTGVGARPEPHLHQPPDWKVHHRTDRVGFEAAIRLCIAAGAPLTCSREEAELHLLGAEGPYKLYRTWGNHPDEPHS